MKQDQQTTYSGSRTTSADVCRWVQTLFDLHARIAARFARPELCRRTLAYLQDILSETERKNGWQLAEHAKEVRPDGMQCLLSSAIWDTDGVRDDLRSYVLEQLGQASAIVAIDETSFPKQGQKSAGVGLQYSLSSFRFVGPMGRFTGHRGYKDGQQTHYWSASRCVRRHTYKHYLGMTESLTIANLERTALPSFNRTSTRARSWRSSLSMISSGSQQVRL